MLSRSIVSRFSQVSRVRKCLHGSSEVAGLEIVCRVRQNCGVEQVSGVRQVSMVN